MAAKILLVGSVMMDLILRCERAPEPSESVLGHDYRNAPGGKGSNAAVAAARAGAQVAAYASVGNDTNGDYLLDRWNDEGVDTTHVLRRDGNTGFVAITLEDNGQNRLIIFPGVNMETPPDALEAAFDAGCDAVLLQFEIPAETNMRAIEIANERGVTTVLDAGPATKNGLDGLPPVTILSPNETETRALVDIYPADEESCREAAKRLQEKNGCRYVVLKLGERGSYIYGDGVDTLVRRRLHRYAGQGVRRNRRHRCGRPVRRRVRCTHLHQVGRPAVAAVRSRDRRADGRAGLSPVRGPERASLASLPATRRCRQ